MHTPTPAAPSGGRGPGSAATKTAMPADQLIEAVERRREQAAARSRPGMRHTPAVAHATSHPGPRPDAAAVANVALTRLRAHHRNVRTDLGDLRDLTESIRTQGVLVPLMAERRGDMLQILHGHRRAAAALLAGLGKVPCLVVAEHTDADAIAVMLAENEQRRNLTPAERQRAVVALRDEFGWKMPAIAQRLGISESSAYRWAQGEDAASVRGGQPPSHPARTWGGRRGTRKPRIKADRVHALLDRWRDPVADGLNPDQAQALLAEVEDLLQGWAPDTTATEQVAS